MNDAAAPRIAADPGLAATCEAVISAVAAFGPYEVRPHKSGLHVVRPDGAGICAIAPDDGALAVTLALPERDDSPRLLTAVRVSPGLWNQRVRIEVGTQVDDAVRGWLERAYRRP